ncbi:glycosyltransferase 1 domain-containing protein 1-like isoform X2 [Tubulanus polymorphus]|uniref:glycosyltransferase 1 domain-containing protein 1-like isoform X2 n=1 Tax=Tubulanus polymorphus TaxID=672921 RepID=UPI003DA5B787
MALSCVKVLMVARIRENCGNNTAADRIRKHLEETPFCCVLKDVNDFHDVTELKHFIACHKITVAIGIHAYHAGKVLHGCGIPYAIIFGGTDLNEYHTDSNILPVMSRVVNEAKYLVTFSAALRKRADSLWAVSDDRFITIPQAVLTNPSTFCLRNYLRKNGYKITRNPPLLFSLIAGIRPVKDPAFLLQAFSNWWQHNQNVLLLIIGPKLNNEFAEEFEKRVKQASGVVFIPGLSLEDTHAVMRDSFIVLNSSLSEGMSCAILEAMSLGVPVIARNIPGNYAIIQHRIDGLLYDTPQEFVKLADEILSDDVLYEKIKQTALEKIKLKHNCDAEKRSYQMLASNLSASYKQSSKTASVLYDDIYS